MEPGQVLVLLLLFGGAIVAVVAAVVILKRQKAAKKGKAAQYSAIYDGLFKHVEGLPLPGGVMVEVFYGRDKITFKKEQQEIALECSKILDIDTITGKDAKAQAAAGAVAGKIIGGGLTGAAIGALAAMSIYLMISYEKDGDSKYILLDVSSSGLLPSKIVKDFKANNRRETAKIEL